MHARSFFSPTGILGFLALLAGPALAQDDQPAWLAGTWVNEDGAVRRTLSLDPDGACTFTIAAGSETESAAGRWSYAEGSLVLEMGGQYASYDMLLAADRGSFALSGGDLGEATLRFRRAGAPAAAGGGPRPGPAPAPSPPARERGPLVGTWVSETEFQKTTLTFLPDGRYGQELVVAGTPLGENGRYEASPGRLVLAPQAGPPVTYEMAIDGSRLTLQVPSGVALVYAKVPGSEERVVAEARAGDAAKAREDDEWRARFPIARLERQPPHVPVGELPADPNVKRIFEAPTVFTGPELYVRFGREAYIYRSGNPPGEFKSSFKWFFLPTGRVYVRFTTYLGSEQPPGRPQPFYGLFYVANVTDNPVWGRYEILPDETVRVELDTGEKITAELRDGRRNLYWDTTVYGNVEWEKEALDRATGGGK